MTHKQVHSRVSHVLLDTTLRGHYIFNFHFFLFLSLSIMTATSFHQVKNAGFLALGIHGQRILGARC